MRTLVITEGGGELWLNVLKHPERREYTDVFVIVGIVRWQHWRMHENGIFSLSSY